MSNRPKILVITGYGLNCEGESRKAWQMAGADVALVHLNDLFANPTQLGSFGALMFIGGFSYGDHMTSGHVFAQRVKHRLREDLQRFIESGRLILGVCNGFQIMIKLGLLPGFDGKYFDQTMALMQNDCGCFQDRWVTLGFDRASPCVFTKGLERMPLPVRHGEGKLFTLDEPLLDRIDSAHMVPCRYIGPDSGDPTTAFPFNPNGSLRAMAGLCDASGRVFGLMPHPEAYLFPENHPHWNRQKLEGRLPEHGAGLQIFRNAVDYLHG